MNPEQIQGMEYIDAIVAEIRKRTPQQSKFNLYQITGDTSGRSQNIIGKVGETVWNKLIRTFNVSINQLTLPRTNPTHQESRVLCNAIFTSYDEC